MSSTLRSFLDAIQTEDPGQLRAVLDTNIRLLVADKVGAPSTDLWGFCIGGDFIPVQIITKLHDLFESGKFSALRFFSCATGSPSYMGTQLEALLQTPGKCSALISLLFTNHFNRNQRVVQPP